MREERQRIQIDALWGDILAGMAAYVSPDDYRLWLQPIRPVEIDESADPVELRLHLPNVLIKNWVRDQYLHYIESLLGEQLQKAAQVRLECAKETFAAPVNSQQKPNAWLITEPSSDMSQSYPEVASALSQQGVPWDDWNNNLEEKYTFENFVVGPSNELAAHAATLIADGYGAERNPFVIYGGTGLGKTHLMQAIGNHLQRKKPKLRVLAMKTNDFFQKMRSAMKTDSMDMFRDYFASIDIFLLDDIHLLVEMKRTQEEVFHLIDLLVPSKKQIVCTSHQMIEKLNLQEVHLTSRMVQGLSVELARPEYETRIAILKKMAEQRNLQLNDRCCAYIAKHLCNHVRELEGALSQVQVQVSLSGQTPTVPLLEKWLEAIFRTSNPRISIDTIQKVTASYYNIRISDLLSLSRRQAIVRPRQMAMKLCKELTSFSLPDIGESFHRDHSTVINAVDRVNKLCDKDAQINEDLSRLLNRCRQSADN